MRPVLRHSFREPVGTSTGCGPRTAGPAEGCPHELGPGTHTALVPGPGSSFAPSAEGLGAYW